MRDKPDEDFSYRPEWIKSNNVGIDVSEVTFVNWNSGGSNSISALANAESNMNYRDKYFSWKNKLVIRYGIGISCFPNRSRGALPAGIRIGLCIQVTDFRKYSILFGQGET